MSKFVRRLTLLIGCLATFMFFYPYFYEKLNGMAFPVLVLVFLLCEFLFEYTIDRPKRAGPRESGNGSHDRPPR
jgi:hypothetical protein